MKKLCVGGKTIDVSRISEKTEAQFATQLRRVVTVTDEEVHQVYTSLHGGMTEEQVKAMREEREAAHKAELGHEPEHHEK